MNRERTIVIVAAALAMSAIALPGCRHKVDVNVEHVAPIEATVNVNLKVQRDLDSYFDYERPTRYPLFNDLKRQGRIGETHLGYLDYVLPEYAQDTTIKTVVEGANRDRQMIYETLASEQQQTLETIARQNALRNFRNAETGHWLRYSDGWRQKTDTGGT